MYVLLKGAQHVFELRSSAPTVLVLPLSNFFNEFYKKSMVKFSSRIKYDRRISVVFSFTFIILPIDLGEFSIQQVLFSFSLKIDEN